MGEREHFIDRAVSDELSWQSISEDPVAPRIGLLVIHSSTAETFLQTFTKSR